MAGASGVKVRKTDEEWRAQLTPDQYMIARRHGTERAFSGPFWNSKEAGIYHCVCCGRPLFSSSSKFESGTGWPSFSEPIDADAVTEHKDRSYFIARTEVRCGDCDSHLGHLFRDGPDPTGLRYCMNGTVLTLEKA